MHQHPKYSFFRDPKSGIFNFFKAKSPAVLYQSYFFSKYSKEKKSQDFIQILILKRKFNLFNFLMWSQRLFSFIKKMSWIQVITQDTLCGISFSLYWLEFSLRSDFPEYKPQTSISSSISGQNLRINSKMQKSCLKT